MLSIGGIMSSGPHTESPPRRPSIAPIDAEALCEQVWPSEQEARRVARELDHGGYDVVHNDPPHITTDRRVKSVAWVRYPLGSEYGSGTVGDVRYRVDEQAGS